MVLKLNSCQPLQHFSAYFKFFKGLHTLRGYQKIVIKGRRDKMLNRQNTNGKSWKVIRIYHKNGLTGNQMNVKAFINVIQPVIPTLFNNIKKHYWKQSC